MVRCFLYDISTHVHARSGSHHDPLAHKDEYVVAFFRAFPNWCLTHLWHIAPHEFTFIGFPVKALKIILHDLQSGGESATVSAQGEVYDIQSDDEVGWSYFYLL